MQINEITTNSDSKKAKAYYLPRATDIRFETP